MSTAGKGLTNKAPRDIIDNADVSNADNNGDNMKRTDMMRSTAIVLTLTMLCGCSSGNAPAVSDVPAVSTTQTVPDTQASETSAASESTVETTTAQTVSETSVSVSETTVSETTAEETVSETTAGESAYIETDYMTLYRNKLTDIFLNEDTEYITYYMFSLYDVGGDDTPELFVSNGEFHMATTELFTVKDGEVISAGNIGSFGEALYFPDKGKFDAQYSGMGYFSHCLVSFDGTQLVSGISIDGYEGFDYENEDYDTAVSEYHIDDREATKEEYDKAYEENFTGKCITLGRDHYLNEHGISAVFDGLGRERTYEELILSVPQDEAVWSAPDKMAYCDIDSDGTEELLLDYGYGCRVYTYDNGLIYCGNVPSYDDPPYEFFDVADQDVAWDDTEMQYILYADTYDHMLFWRMRSSYELQYVFSYENGRIIPTELYQKYPLKDGSYLYAINGRKTDEAEFLSYSQLLFTDTWDEIGFEELAVG